MKATKLEGDIPTVLQVAAYNEAGLLETLPSLLQGRNKHACGHYVDADLNLVRIGRFQEQLMENGSHNLTVPTKGPY